MTAGISIAAGGYYEFGAHFPDAHRGLWIDIDLDEALGGPTDIMRHRPQARRLTNQLPGVAARYLTFVEREYRRLDIPRRLARVAEDTEVQRGMLTKSQLSRYERLHQQVYEVRRQAEEKCRKLRMGGVSWSPKI